jgi:GTP-binding protein HflX
VEQQISAVEGVLEDLGCGKDKQMLVLNKTDLLIDPAVRTLLAGKCPDAVFLSAATGLGAEALLAAVAHRAVGQPVRVVLHANCRNGRLMQFIAQHAQVHARSFDDATARIEALMPAKRIEELRRFGKDVSVQAQVG